jgi:hypothetical protein
MMAIIGDSDSVTRKCCLAQTGVEDLPSFESHGRYTSGEILPLFSKPFIAVLNSKYSDDIGPLFAV